MTYYHYLMSSIPFPNPRSHYQSTQQNYPHFHNHNSAERKSTGYRVYFSSAEIQMLAKLSGLYITIFLHQYIHPNGE